MTVTPTERDVLRLLAQRKPQTEIAACLGIDSAEIDAYLRSLYSAMGVSNTSEAITSASQRGLLPE
jgi:DNA-binding CsgD family transcriptional regulator